MTPHDSGIMLADRLTWWDYVEEVSRQHPSIEAAEAAWQSAREIHPQVTALPDPQFRFLTGPTFFGNNAGAHLWRLQAQQPLDGWGKRDGRIQLARQQASVAQEELNAARWRLRQTASQVYFDYALAEAVAPLVEAERRIAEQELLSKQVRLTSGEAASAGGDEQFQLDRIELDRSAEEFHWRRLQAVQRVNLLLGRHPYAPLPPPAPPPLPPPQWTHDQAMAEIISRHPALLQAEARCREAEARVELARCNYHPDFTIVSRFDTNADDFWLPERANVRPQLGFNVVVPLHQDKLAAAVREAQGRLRQRRAERQLVLRQIEQEVAEMFAELDRTQHKLQRQTALSGLARRKAEMLDRGGPQGASASGQLQARRQSLKYEIERVNAEYDWRQKLTELTAHLDMNLADSRSVQAPSPLISALLPPLNDFFSDRPPAHAGGGLKRTPPVADLIRLPAGPH